MATLDSTGITTLDLSQHFAALQARFVESFGEDLATDSETPQGQIIGIFAETFAEIDEGLVQLVNAFGVDTAAGAQLDDLFSLANVERKLSTVSTVTATMTGVAGTRIPAGTRARTTAGDIFALRRDVLIPQTLSVDGVFASVKRGAVPIPRASLTQIVNVIPGWETVTNALAGVEGIESETDSELRTRGQNQVSQNSTGTIPAIQSALTKIGVARSKVIENDTASAVSMTGLANIPAYSIVAIVEGGLDDQVAKAIADNKTLGAPTFGSSSGTADGRTINFERVVEVGIKVAVTIDASGSFPNNGVNLIKAALVRHANSHFDIGTSVDLEQMRVPVYSIQGVTLTAITVTDTSDTALPTATPVQRLYTLTAANIEVSTN